jgi:hypothetical protein
MHPPGADAQMGSSAACSTPDEADRPSTGSGVELDVVVEACTVEDVDILVIVPGVDAPEPEHAVSTAAHSTVRCRHVTTTVCRSVSVTVTPEDHDRDVDPICGAERSEDGDAPSSAPIGGQWFCCEGCRDVFLAARAWPSGTEA